MNDSHPFEKFVSGGFLALVDDDAERLCRYLEERAVESGLAWFVFLAEAIEAVHRLRIVEDNAGGVRADFLRQLSQLTEAATPRLIEGSAASQAKAAREYRDIVIETVSSYSPLKGQVG